MLYDIYEADDAARIRFALGKGGKRTLYVMGVNPSTATAERPDMTISKVHGFAACQGYDGFVVLNLYPLRATDPSGLPDRPDRTLLHRNLEIVCRYLLTGRPAIWAAWGNLIESRSYLSMCLRHLVEAVAVGRPRWLRCGQWTARRHPRHPSRLAYASRFQAFDIQAYTKRLETTPVSEPVRLR